MKALVTGGGGFVGKAVALALSARGDSVRVLGRGDYADLRRAGLELIRADVADRAAVIEAARGCDVVFHVAAKTGVWGSEADFVRTNVLGTEHVIEACREGGVSRLVFTSSPSVVAGRSDLRGVSEDVPYLDDDAYLSDYPRTKARAEKLVLAAHSPTLATTALRPHLVWGPGDNHLVPRIVQRARAGRLRLVDRGRAVVDSTYIDNAARAHLLAADALAWGSANGGKAYFISNGEPLAVADLVNRILRAADAPEVHKSVSGGVAYALGWALEIAYSVLGREEEPLMTRFVAKQLSTDHWFNLSAAKRDFGYAPTVSVAEGLERLAASFRTAAT